MQYLEIVKEEKRKDYILLNKPFKITGEICVWMPDIPTSKHDFILFFISGLIYQFLYIKGVYQHKRNWKTNIINLT